MRLQQLKINGYGPFAIEQTLEIEEDVTILTGANDVGKSAILRLIQMICDDLPNQQSDANKHRGVESGKVWNEDDGIYCEATFTSNFHITNKDKVMPGDVIEIRFYLTSDKIAEMIRHQRGNSNRSVIPYGEVSKYRPDIIRYSNIKEIKNQINKDSSPNATELSLLEVAFGKNPFEQLQAVEESDFHSRISDGAEKLNSFVQQILPAEMGLQFRLSADRFPKINLHVGFKDKWGSDTPMDYRGSGVRKIMSIIAYLLNSDKDKSTIILMDEPENSLHANSQHLLRTFLERLAENENIQVVYATHSPSMINNFRPHNIRLLRRESRDGIATTVIDNKPYGDNYLKVRTQLGITPADSLLYAPITIIVEGPTEVVCLPIILLNWFKEDMRTLLSQIHILDGIGTGWASRCDLAVSQGANPIIFVDGDDIKKVKQAQIKNKFPDIPIITLSEGLEFEDIVPREQYFQALAEITKQDTTEEKYNEWEKNQSLHPKMMFSKRVTRWLQDEFEIFSFKKYEVMKKALDLVDDFSLLNEGDKFKDLVEEIKNQLSKSTV